MHSDRNSEYSQSYNQTVFRETSHRISSQTNNPIYEIRKPESVIKIMHKSFVQGSQTQTITPIYRQPWETNRSTVWKNLSAESVVNKPVSYQQVPQVVLTTQLNQQQQGNHQMSKETKNDANSSNQSLWVKHNKDYLNPATHTIQGDEVNQPQKIYQKHTGKTKKKERKQNLELYSNSLKSQNSLISNPHYQYHYEDGYSGDRQELIKKASLHQNSESANNWVQVDQDFHDTTFAKPNNNMTYSQFGLNEFRSEKKVNDANSSNKSNTLRVEKAFSSGVFGGYVPAQKFEEERQVNASRSTENTVFSNSVISTFKNENSSNQIDDLTELLEDSRPLEKARQIAKNGKFTDPDFPPNVKSIIGFGEGNFQESKYAQFPFLRAPEFFNGSFKVFDKMEPCDIEQGALGDCYFLASISALAEYHKRTERLFLSKEVNKESIYVMALCESGIWSEIILDDFTPCDPRARKPIFNQSSTNELWVIFLEKAWAKINGGYQNIAAGLTREALRSLTGASCKTFYTDSEREALWKEILLANEMDFIMTGCTQDLNNGSDSYQEKIGICGSHAYSLLGAFEVQQVNGKWTRLKSGERPRGNVERLVQLRNPWGKCEWKGKWGDTDSSWNSELRKELDQNENADDGKFCMTYNEFVKYYDTLQICYYHDDYKYSALKLQSKPNDTVNLTFNVNQSGVYFFSLNQKLTRAFPKSKRYDYSPLSFTISQIQSNGQPKQLATQLKPDFENWVQLDVVPGQYVVSIKTPWKSFVNEFSFSCYGPECVAIELVNPNQIPQDFQQKALDNKAKDDTNVQTFNFAKHGYPEIIYKFADDKQGHGYLFIENGTSNIVFEGIADFSASSGITLKAPFNGLKPSFSLQPKKNITIAFEAVAFPCNIAMKIIAGFNKTSPQPTPIKPIPWVKPIPNYVPTPINPNPYVKPIPVNPTPNNLPIINNISISNNQALIETLRQSKNIRRPHNSSFSNRQVRTYNLTDPNFIAMLYVNDEPKTSYHEEVIYVLVNAAIEGVNGNVSAVHLKPNQEQLVKIVPIVRGKPFDARVTQMTSWFL